MEERAISRREMLQQIDERIEIYLALNEKRRDFTMETIKNDEREIEDNFEKYYFAKKRETDRRLKDTCVDNLLTFVDSSLHGSQRPRY